MNNTEIQTTHPTHPPIILLYGVQGMGKSSLGSEMPNPIFIQTTDGLEGLGVQAFPLAKVAQDVRDQLNWLLNNKHDFRTVVIDTVGWLEKLIHAECCAQLNLEFMTQSSVKSYPLAKQKLFEIKELWDRLNTEKNMFVLLIGHANIEKFEDPTVSSYDRYQVDMNDKCAGMLLQDSDIVAFMNQKIAIREESKEFSKETIKKASQTSSRYLYFDPRPAFFAKDHNYGMPPELLALPGQSWGAMWDCMKKKFTAPKKKTTTLVDVKKDKQEKSLEKTVLSNNNGETAHG